MVLITYIWVAALAYLLGSVPTGFLVGKSRGVDIRARGSGNIGATNAFRILGTPAGILVLFIDGLKGFAATAWLVNLAAHFQRLSSAETETLQIVAGLSTILGHNYTCWLKFKGGKGIATSAGVIAALASWSLLVGLAVWLMVFLISRYVSLASLMAALSLPFATWAIYGNLGLVAAASAMMALAIFQHRRNIQRLLQGTENRFGPKRREAAP